MNTATLADSRTTLNSYGYEVSQTVYRLDPPLDGCEYVVVSHVDPADGCDPTGVFLGETLDGGADLTYAEWKSYTARRRYFRDVMTDSEALQTLGYVVDTLTTCERNGGCVGCNFGAADHSSHE